MNMFSRLFGRRAQPDRSFVEYPDGHLKSARQALERGLRLYRTEGAGRRALISWQGQGGRTDSYHVVNLELSGELVSFRTAPIDLEAACKAEGVSFDSLRQPTTTEVSIASLSDRDAAALIEALLVKHFGVKPFEDSKDYCVGFEYDQKG